MDCRFMGVIVGQSFENARKKNMKDFKEKYVHLTAKIPLDFS